MNSPNGSDVGVTPVQDGDSDLDSAAEMGLLGRDSELDVLRQLILSGRDAGGAVVVRGAAGVGKSSLLAAAANIAHEAGSLVLEASGIESEAMLPFAGLHQLLGPLMGQSDSIAPVQESALLTAFGLQEGPSPQLFLIALAALTLLVDVAATRPVVLVVDDRQWLDSPTNDVLAFISRRVSDDPVVIISGLRDGHPIGSDLELVQGLALFGLDESSSQAILDTVANDLSAAQRRDILAYALGNPLALVELPTAFRSAAGGSPGPTNTALPLTTRLERAFAARITELPARTRDALLIAAIDAEESLSEVLAGTAVLSGVPVSTDVLDPAEEGRITHVRLGSCALPSSSCSFWRSLSGAALP